MEPAVTDAAATAERTAANNTAFAIIAALSFCHLLNDMMQSLIAAIYPMLKANYGLDFGQIGLLTFTFQVTASLLQPLIGIYTDKRPQPYSLSLGMGFTLVGLILLGFARSLLAAARRFGAGRHGLVGVPSGILARRAHGVGRAARPGAIAVPGRRQFRLGARPAARRLHRAAEGPDERRLVLARGAARDDHSLAGRRLVSRPSRRQGQAAELWSDDCAAAPQSADRAGRAWRADLFEIHLYVEPVELLHVLSHP